MTTWVIRTQWKGYRKNVFRFEDLNQATLEYNRVIAILREYPDEFKVHIAGYKPPKTPEMANTALVQTVANQFGWPLNRAQALVNQLIKEDQ